MDLFDKLKKEISIPPSLFEKGHFVVDDNVGLSLFVSLATNVTNNKYLLITSNLYKATKLYNQVKSLLPDSNVLLFPNDELIRAESLSESKEMVAQRIYVLNEILNNKPSIIITNIAGATRFLPNKETFSSKVTTFEVGKSYDLQAIRSKLARDGYSLVNKIDQSLQFAIRGDILDIYSVNLDNPIRIEFFGDEVESIRFFDLAHQTSIEKVNKVEILPASDILFTENELLNVEDRIFDVLEKEQKALSRVDFENLRDSTVQDLEDIKQGYTPQRTYKYYGFIQDRHYSLFDYCIDFKKLLIDIDAIEQSNKMLQEESLSYLSEMSEDAKIITHLEMYQNLFRLINRDGKDTIYTTNFITKHDDITFGIKSVLYRANKKSDAFSIIQNYLGDGYDIVVAINNKENIQFLQEILTNNNVSYEMVHDFNVPKKAKVGISLLNIAVGFALPKEKLVYLTANELFNEKVKVGRYDNRFKEGTILKSFEDLKPGDYVVHEYQGIGQFLELTNIEVDGIHKDYLKIAYHGNEFLYVPLAQFQLVRKFQGKEGASPRLSHLHSKDWENTKKRIKEKVNDLANRLMNLYIERSKIKGFAFAEDDEFQQEFENNFEYELTRDQITAIKEIKEDMEKDCPMDRLLCGDVGFGKTEVAFEAAFKAINSGKQVAILCPTTLLARQHYELAIERFAPFDINIAILSRLVSDRDINTYIEGIRSGKVHLVIGTHKLLSKRVVFKDLGLLIIDEEQRFGVEQKEIIKELKKNIDVLTLSATPIPRTLQISLLGVRSLSRINTAPMDRMPIQTYVLPYKLDVIKELISRELGRDGQVFYLHNNISTLYMCAHKIEHMVPEARIAVAHGRMQKDEIEDTMIKFYKGEIDVLVCTSIIENGIDVPNANMIIVEDAEHYGLSQLYQIKGRVGRSNRIAYAYLMYNEHKVMNEKAMKRLQAIQEFTELGSGYKIAQRDLMIRGAGDILGPEQAGFIDSIGLDMYIKLLNEAVQEKLNGTVEEEHEVKNNPTLNVDAYIPDDYAKNSDKIELYQEILSAVDLDSLERIKDRTIDIYGKLPEEVESLFLKRTVDLLSEKAEVQSITEGPKFIDIVLGDNYVNIRGAGNILFEALIPFLNNIKVSYIERTFKVQVFKKGKWLVTLKNILIALLNIIETNKIKTSV